MSKQDMNITKVELVDMIAQSTGATKVMVTQMMDAFQEAVTKSLKKGSKVTWTGFVTFDVKQREAREGTTAFNGKQWKSPARKVPSVRLGKTIKEDVK